MHQIKVTPKCWVFIPAIYGTKRGPNKACAPGKARPRLSGKRTHLPESYVAWRNDAIKALSTDVPKSSTFREVLFPASWIQMSECRTKGAIKLLQTRYHQPVTGVAPSTSLDVRCRFVGRLAADLDNAVGSVLDLLVKMGLLEDDSPRYVRRVIVEMDDYSDDPPGCYIEVMPFV